MQINAKTQQEIDTEIVDFSFYLIQRGEAGHKRGCYLNEYGDSKGIRTIGYGTVTEAGYNHLNYRNKTVTEEQAVLLAKEEMQHKLYEKCRTQFKDFDKLLPCYQALILDATYQGNWGQFVDELNAGDMTRVFEIVGNNPNKERAAVRMRAVEMGIMTEAALKQAPDANPEDVARLLADQMIKKYQHLNGTDTELTKDELALLYRSCMMAYGVEVTPEQIETFALSFPQVMSGTHGIGSNTETPQWMARSDYQMTTYQRGDGSILYRTRSRPRGRLSDNYAPTTRMGRSVRIPSVNIPVPRYQQIGNVNYNTSYSAYYQKPRTGGKKPDMIVIHSTEDRPGGAEHGVISYLASANSRSVSAHIVIGRDGTPYMLVPPEKQANHAGVSYWNGDHGVNDRSIGIEVVRATDEGYTREQAATLLAVVGQLSKDYGITPDKVLGHDEVAPHRKTDPGKDFDPIWDAMAKEGLALPASAHENIKTQLGANHNVHAQHMDPTLANVTTKECAYLVPAKGARGEAPAALPSDLAQLEEEGWSVKPLEIDLKKKEEAERRLAQEKAAQEKAEAAQKQSQEAQKGSKDTSTLEVVGERVSVPETVLADSAEKEVKDPSPSTEKKKSKPKKKKASKKSIGKNKTDSSKSSKATEDKKTETDVDKKEKSAQEEEIKTSLSPEKEQKTPLDGKGEKITIKKVEKAVTPKEKEASK